MNDAVPLVTTISSARDDTWGVEFDDGITLYVAKVRDEAHIDALIAQHEDAGDDPDHTARMHAMITAVREHEAESTP